MPVETTKRKILPRAGGELWASQSDKSYLLFEIKQHYSKFNYGFTENKRAERIFTSDPYINHSHSMSTCCSFIVENTLSSVIVRRGSSEDLYEWGLDT